ncbi:low temperature requirement protein A [Streptomyces chiangmaiensis]|uniref:Low temperature requirement protein A n=1 Tax=Streptomyces chiangmaiensis TaxID=766497 RepID=A0ABU7FRH0_9ACTN|nr:low temperature requirement protein A [Streptomyces chiangmaiensis]MED7826573.1 low temperature requirement protein A [Streptomyces chiangmaiensis]
MIRRDPQEAHRVATPLELLFDLCFVVAVAQAGGKLEHAVLDGHAGHGVSAYAMIFFAIWWAWMNFTWFASAYDTDDVPYRLTTLLQIAGVLVLAAGVSRAVDRADYSIVMAGYVMMRLALTTQWVRAARGERGAARATALRYAFGVVLVQIGWAAFAFLPHHDMRPWVFVLLAAAELAVPVVAERPNPTSWHPHHIAERYGLFTLIVLGETVAAATMAVQRALDRGSSTELLPIAAGGLLIVFAAYWIYFVVPIHEHLSGGTSAFRWGYGHYLVFSTAAAIGAGLQVAIEHVGGEAHIGTATAAASVTVPAAGFVFFTWLLHARHYKPSLGQQAVLPLTAAAILACTFAGSWAVLCAGAVAALSVVASLSVRYRGSGPDAVTGVRYD